MAIEQDIIIDEVGLTIPNAYIRLTTMNYNHTADAAFHYYFHFAVYTNKEIADDPMKKPIKDFSLDINVSSEDHSAIVINPVEFAYSTLKEQDKYSDSKDV